MADILIRGMEMPKEGCKDCLLVKRGQVFDICPFLKREVNGNVERGGKPLDCPLVPVPPHGRLIDADALMNLIREHSYPLTAHFNSTDYGMFTIGIQQAVDETPTIIEAEEEQE